MTTDLFNATDMAADMAAMASDMPITCFWESRAIAGTHGTIGAQFANTGIGYLDQYRLSVWLPVAGMQALPTTGKQIVAGGVLRQILGTGDYDGAAIRLDLGDPVQ